MSNLKQLWGYIRNHPGRLLLGLSAVVAVIDAALATASLAGQSHARQLFEEVGQLQASLEDLRQVDQMGLDSLAAEVRMVEAQLDAFVQGFPRLGEPFDLFRRGFNLAEGNRVQIESIQRLATTTESTPIGYLSVTAYDLQATAEFPDCLAYIASLEDAGLETLALENLLISPTALNCDFQVLLAISVESPPDSAEPGVAQ